ncbi:steroid receptor RNA activator 1-like [Anopheles marshallii]|uniref:steroid receptor RNA activator 1-like n=1 Tax=Anopheles marshallii TaxID=1521116 RepID=UPI00237BC8F3|nr:steroid receptor RNA activator 1-like [Anopheles marshallii]
MSGENYRSPTKSHEPGWNDPPPKLASKRPVTTSDGSDNTPSREGMFDQIQTVFNEYVQRVDDTRRATVQKRFNLMYQQWTDKKLPEVLEKLIYMLATALLDQDVNRANAVHRTIVCDHGSVCTMWAPVLRHPIMELQQRSDQTGHDENSIVQPIQSNED